MPVDRFRVLALVQGIELSFLENTPKASCLASFMEVEVRSLFTLFSKAYRKPSFGAALPGDFTGLPSSSGEACLPSSAADELHTPSSPPHLQDGGLLTLPPCKGTGVDTTQPSTCQRGDRASHVLPQARRVFPKSRVPCVLPQPGLNLPTSMPLPFPSA